MCCQLRDDLLSGSYPLGKIEQFMDEKDATLARNVLANSIG
nr:hypothetical protein [Coxiella-like endosymbiont]